MSEENEKIAEEIIVKLADKYGVFTSFMVRDDLSEKISEAMNQKDLRIKELTSELQSVGLERDTEILRGRKAEQELEDAKLQLKCGWEATAKALTQEPDALQAKLKEMMQWFDDAHKVQVILYDSMLKSMEHEKALEARLSLMQELIKKGRNYALAVRDFNQVRNNPDSQLLNNDIAEFDEALSSVAVPNPSFRETEIECPACKHHLGIRIEDSGVTITTIASVAVEQKEKL